MEEKEKTAVVPGQQSAGGATVVKGRSQLLLDAEKEKMEAEKASIWNADQVPLEDALLCNKAGDDREVPRYEFSYKQVVGTEDTILGMNDKTPGSQDCSHLIIKVHFPGCTMRDLDLDVTKSRIRAESKTFKLFTYLPVSVDHDKGNAKFDTKKCVLTVVVPIISSMSELLSE